MAARSPILDQGKFKTSLAFQDKLRAAQETSGKPYAQQVAEILGLMMGPGKIDAWEYFMYGLYDDRLYSADDKARFVGRKLIRTLTRRYLKDALAPVTTDKMRFYAHMQARGFAAPRTLAVFRKRRRYEGAPMLDDLDAVARFLREGLAYPAFAKPVEYTRSIGVARLEGYDRATDTLRLGDGRRVAVADFVAEVAGFAKHGYLFQEPLVPHPEIAALCGPRVSTVRALVLLEDDGPHILRAAWKVPVGDNPADNFWRRGNMLAAVEVETGRVARVIERGFPGQEEIETHPDTGARLAGASLPDWPALRALCLAAATAFPGSPIQGWDIALCETGPIAVEVEGNGGDPMMTQLPWRRGLLDDRFAAHLEACRRRRPRAA